MPTKGGYSGGRAGAGGSKTIATPGGGTLTVGGVKKGAPLSAETTAVINREVEALRASQSPNELDDLVSAHMKDLRYLETAKLGSRTVVRFYLGDTLGSATISPLYGGRYAVSLSLAGVSSRQSNPYNKYAQGLEQAFTRAEAMKFVAQFKRS